MDNKINSVKVRIQVATTFPRYISARGLTYDASPRSNIQYPWCGRLHWSAMEGTVVNQRKHGVHQIKSIQLVLISNQRGLLYLSTWISTTLGRQGGEDRSPKHQPDRLSGIHCSKSATLDLQLRERSSPPGRAGPKKHTSSFGRWYLPSLYAW
jgi:hypothetical protein